MILLHSNSTIASMSSNAPCHSQKLIGLIMDRLNSDLGNKVDCGDSTGHSHTLSILNFFLDRPFGFSAHQDTHFFPSRPFEFSTCRVYNLLRISLIFAQTFGLSGCPYLS